MKAPMKNNPQNATMRAFVLSGHGGFDKLEWHEDWPRPEPKAGEVLIRVAACGLNNTDINTRTAWYAPEVEGGITQDSGAEGFDPTDTTAATWGGAALAFPRIQGADVTGEIVGVGAGVSEHRIGQRVLCDPWVFRAGEPLYVGSELDGGFAEYCALPAENAYVINTSLSAEELATTPCALSTAENLVARTHLRPGERVAISGASGGVGSFALQLAKLRGAYVIAIATASKHEALLALGADEVIDRNNPKIPHIDVALDVVGKGMFGPLVNALRRGGRYSSCGAIAGAQVDFDLRDLIYRDLTFTGATVVPQYTFGRLVALLELGKIKPQLGGTFALKDLHAAQEAFLAKGFSGNLVVTC